MREGLGERRAEGVRERLRERGAEGVLHHEGLTKPLDL